MGLGRWKYTFPDERARLLGIRFFSQFHCLTSPYLAMPVEVLECRGLARHKYLSLVFEYGFSAWMMQMCRRLLTAH